MIRDVVIVAIAWPTPGPCTQALLYYHTMSHDYLMILAHRHTDRHRCLAQVLRWSADKPKFVDCSCYGSSCWLLVLDCSCYASRLKLFCMADPPGCQLAADVGYSDMHLFLGLAWFLTMILAFVFGLCVCCMLPSTTTTTHRQATQTHDAETQTTAPHINLGHVFVTQQGETFHGDSACFGLRNARATRRLRSCQLCARGVR